MTSRTLFEIFAVVVIVVALVWFWIFAERTDIVENVPLSETHDVPGTQAPAPPITLASTTVSFPDGTEHTFALAGGFTLNVAAEGLGKARFMAVSPDRRLFVPNMVNYNLSHAGQLFVLDDFNDETKQFETQHVYLSGLRGPNSVAFYTDQSGQTWLYLALTEHLLRYRYESGDTSPSGEPEIVAEFPNEQSPGEESVVWHITRTLLFVDDTLYISVGSGCNACEELAGSMRAMIIAMNPDGTNQRAYADGLRNTVGIEWAEGALYATANGVDHLGPNAPDELLYKLTPGVNYGWPYCYELDGEIIFDESQQWNTPRSCEDVPHSLTAFTPRSAPLGITYFDEGAHETLAGTFLVALHGSFEPETRAGYKLVRVTLDGEQEIFMDGFQRVDATRVGRPVHVLGYNKDTILFTDDFAGRIYAMSVK